MLINGWEIVVLIGISQGCIFSITLLVNNLFKYQETNKYLAYSLLLLSTVGFVEFLHVHHIDDQYILVDFVTNDVPWITLFYVPMFIFFLRSGKHKISRNKHLWWLTGPFFIFLTLNLVIPNIPILIQHYTSMGLITILCIASLIAVKTSNISLEEKNWLLRIWGFNIGILVVWIIADFMPDHIYNNFNGEITYPVWLAYSLFMFWLMFKGLLQLELSQDKSAIRNLLSNQGSQVIHTSSQTTKILDSNSLIAYFKEFESLLTKEKLYRNPDLSREDIANRIGISPSYLSKSIKTCTDKNFTSLVNSFRVVEVKEMLQNPAFNPYNIWAIGMEAGFKSKSSFFEVFKKETGITPTQYKLLKEES